MMQYDDDAEESKVSESKNLSKETKSKQNEESKTKAVVQTPTEAEQTLEDIIGSDDEDDLFADDPMAFIER